MPNDHMTMHEALVLLHEGTRRQGPGDDRFSLDILNRLPKLPPNGTIADLGCGTGIASVLLAKHFQRPVLCVDTSEEFLQALRDHAESAGVGHLIKPLCADMGALDPKQYQFDLLWSEGAAYILTFAGALQKWRPLMAEGGLALVSELSWFGPERPKEALAFWTMAYPDMVDEQANVESAERNGFEVLFTERLPAQAWWTNYYAPLSAQLEVHAGSSSPTVQEAIAETRQEMDLFRAHSAFYGYTFYVLKAV